MRSVQNQNRELLLITVLQHTNSKSRFMPKPSAICVTLGNRCNICFRFHRNSPPSKVCTDACCWWSWMHCSHSERAPLFQYSRCICFGVGLAYAEFLCQSIPLPGCLSGAIAHADSGNADRPGNYHSQPFCCVLPGRMEFRSSLNPRVVATTPPELKDHSTPQLFIGSFRPPQRLIMNLSAAYTRPSSLLHNIKCMC